MKKKVKLSREEVDQLEKLIAGLDALHSEISALAKKSSKDAVNDFKLRFVNQILRESNGFLGANYQPLDGFLGFEGDDVPSNSDVTFIIAQYIEAMEKFRSDHLIQYGGGWYYDLVEEEKLTVKTGAPAKLKKK